MIATWIYRDVIHQHIDKGTVTEVLWERHNEPTIPPEFEWEWLQMIAGAHPACDAPDYNWQALNLAVFAMFVGEMKTLLEEREQQYAAKGVTP